MVQYLVEEKGADIKERNNRGKFYYLVSLFIYIRDRYVDRKMDQE